MKKIVFLLFLMLFYATTAMAGEKTLQFTWDQDVPSDMGGWKLYQSISPMTDCKIDGTEVMNIVYTGQTEYQATHQLTSPDGQTATYYWRLTAYDTSANESDCSNEVSKAIDFETPGIPFSLDVVIIAQ